MGIRKIFSKRLSDIVGKDNGNDLLNLLDNIKEQQRKELLDDFYKLTNKIAIKSEEELHSIKNVAGMMSNSIIDMKKKAINEFNNIYSDIVNKENRVVAYIEEFDNRYDDAVNKMQKTIDDFDIIENRIRDTLNNIDDIESGISSIENKIKENCNNYLIKYIKENLFEIIIYSLKSYIRRKHVST